MLMHADDGGVDRLDSGTMRSGKCIYDAAPDAGPSRETDVNQPTVLPKPSRITYSGDGGVQMCSWLITSFNQLQLDQCYVDPCP